MNNNNKHLNEEKLEARDLSLTTEDKTVKKLGNFWYHNKWTIIIVAFFVAVLVIVSVQLLTRVEYDVNVTISGPDFLNSEKLFYVRDDLSSDLKADINGDGKKAVSVTTYPVFSESELKAINHSKKDSNGNYIKIVEESENLSQYKQFVQHSQTGDTFILILSKYVYEPLKATNPSRLLPLSDIYESSLPEGALADGYGIKLSDTAIYRDSATLQGFADDYIICICKLPDMASKKQTKAYELSIEYFKDLVG